jgi:arylformamidase
MEKKDEDTIIIISKTFYDLTQVIGKDIPVYPGDPQPDFESSSTIKKDNYNVTRIIFGSHSSTRVDAQSN